MAGSTLKKPLPLEDRKKKKPAKIAGLKTIACYDKK
jgi:hypothetical protein